MSKETIKDVIFTIKNKQSLFYEQANSLAREKFLNKKVNFKSTKIIDDDKVEAIYEGLVKDVVATSDCDLMFEVEDVQTLETKFIFSYNILEVE